MVTVMCPNCQHRFPAPGCCNPATQQEESNRLMAPDYEDFYDENDFQVRNPSQSSALNEEASNGETSAASSKMELSWTGYHMITNGDHTGGGVTITTPRNQSGGCVVECIDSGILFQSPTEISDDYSPMLDEEELRDLPSPNLVENECCCSIPPSGCQELPGMRSNCMGERNCYCSRNSRNTCSSNQFDCHRAGSSVENNQHVCGCHNNQQASGCHNNQQASGCHNNQQASGCHNNQQTSGCHNNQLASSCHNNLQASGCHNNQQVHGCRNNQQGCSCHNNQQASGCHNNQQGCCCKNNNHHTSQVMMVRQSSPAIQLSVNATVQLPANLGQCTINLTATTNSLRNSTDNSNNSSTTTTSRSRNNFNGGGIIQPDINYGMNGSNLERRDTTPSTPISWLMPCPWTFDSILMNQVAPSLCDVKKKLWTSGWYYPDLRWQQSQVLVKGASVGSWLVRDSSDPRFIFTVTVHIPKGATSVRVHHDQGKFRFDAVAHFTKAMPLFDCPIKLIEYYVMYSKMKMEKNEYWLDCATGTRRQIYMTKPLVKEVRPLSHLARLVVNKHQLHTYKLPPLIRKYLAEYPYTI